MARAGARPATMGEAGEKPGAFGGDHPGGHVFGGEHVEKSGKQSDTYETIWETYWKHGLMLRDFLAFSLVFRCVFGGFSVQGIGIFGFWRDHW